MLRKFAMALAMAIVCAVASPSFASLRTVSAGDMIQIRYNGYGYRQGTGGEFQVYDGSGNQLFHTFCAELSEYIYDKETIKVVATSLSTSASGKALTSGAAKLYREYFDGIAANNYGFPGMLSNITVGGKTFHLGGTDAERASDGEALQEALWALMGWGNSLSSSLATDFYNYGLAYSASNPNEFHDVRILNLMSVDGNRQDQFGVIPEASTIAVWSVLALIGGVRAYRCRGRRE